jgi:RNA polymerase sigma-70 factor (ECF subfamily)
MVAAQYASRRAESLDFARASHMLSQGEKGRPPVSRAQRPHDLRPMRAHADPQAARDAATALRAQDGEVDALAELHTRYRQRLEAVAFRVLRDREEAEDVVQRVFLALPRASYRGTASLWTYLYRAAMNGAVGVLRSRRRRRAAETELQIRQLFAEPEGADPEARVLEGEILSAVASALLHVKPQHRRALVLRIVWGLSNTEIAEREGVPLPTVGTWLRRGREELRARLGPLLRDLDLGEKLG